MKRCATIVLGILVAVASAVPLRGHHWVSEEFDLTKVMRFSGVVTRVIWRHPHVLIYVHTTDPKTNAVAIHMCEFGSPDNLIAAGWNSRTVMSGITVSVVGNPSKRGRNAISAKSITLPNGKTMNATQLWMRAPKKR
jgi:hypothetical protein